MSRLTRHLRAWWTLSRLGPARKVSGAIEQYYRYQVLKLLHDEGFFDYLRELRPYGQVLAQLNFADTDYTRDLFDLLATEKQNVLVRETTPGRANPGVQYRANPEHTPPTLDDLHAQTDPRFHDFAQLAGRQAQSVIPRLRRQPVEFTEGFEEEGRELLQVFDRLLANQLYSVMRATVFSILSPADWAGLRSGRLLIVGCGSGHEPAEIWLRLDGQARITGIDPVSSMVARAEANFAALLAELQPDHPPLTDKNRPVFKTASATHLPFGDDTFDAAFHAHILHWTADPRRAIAEIVRVVRPGGLIFGLQTCKPYTSLYTDIIVRSNENCHGFFWREEFRRWYAEQGVELEIATPAGAFRARKPTTPRAPGRTLTG